MRYVFVIAWLALSAADVGGQTPGDRWPGFRGDGSSRTAAKDLPTEWSGDTNIAWTYDLPGYGQAVPVVRNGVAYVVAAQEDGEKMRDGYQVIALDVATGEALWWTGFTATQRKKLSSTSVRAAPTPVVADDGLYVFFESGDLAALDLDGEVRWQRALTTEYGPFVSSFGLAASLALTDEAVVVLVDQREQSYLLLADRTTGKTLLKKDRDTDTSYASPVVVAGEDRPSLLVTSEKEVGELDLTTGEPMWTVACDDMVGAATPVLAGNGLVVIGDAFKTEAIAVRRGGAGDVTKTHIAWRLPEFDIEYNSPLVVDGLMLAGASKKLLWCVDVATGEPLWTHELRDALWASPLSDGKHVYCFTRGGDTHILRPDRDGPNEVRVNTLAIDTNSEPNDRLYGAAAVDGALLIHTGRKVICIRAKD